MEAHAVLATGKSSCRFAVKVEEEGGKQRK